MPVPEDRFSRVSRAIAELGDGKAVVLVDDDGTGDLAFAAEWATPQLVSFTVRHTSGYVVVALSEHTCDRLNLPPMHYSNGDPSGNACTVSVDAKDGVTTGISATDRAHTIRLLGSSTTRAADLVRPGHIVPVCASAGGVLARPGRHEAMVDLARLAGLQPAGALCGIVSQLHLGEMAQVDEVHAFARSHGLALVTIADVVAYRRRFEKQIERAAQARIPALGREFIAYGYNNTLDGIECVALVCGGVRDGANILVQLHQECLAADVFGASQCDCRAQLDAALAAIVAAERGLVLYMRYRGQPDPELLNKLQSCRLRKAATEAGPDQAHVVSTDARFCSTGAQVLDDLGVRSVCLFANNAEMRASLQSYGVRVGDCAPASNRSAVPNVHYLPASCDRTDPGGANAELTRASVDGSTSPSSPGDSWVCSA